jgi:hypothetical protein
MEPGAGGPAFDRSQPPHRLNYFMEPRAAVAVLPNKSGVRYKIDNIVNTPKNGFVEISKERNRTREHVHKSASNNKSKQCPVYNPETANCAWEDRTARENCK